MATTSPGPEIKVVVGAPPGVLTQLAPAGLNVRTQLSPAGPQGPQGPPGTVGPFREGHTFAVLGNLAPVTVLPSFFVPKAANQTVKLSALRAKIVSGTSIAVQIKRNGSDVGSPITVTPTTTSTSLGDIALADGDEISAVCSAHSGAPTTLSATVVLEWSVP